MFQCKLTVLNMISQKFARSLYISRILGSWINYGSNGVIFKRNSASNAATESQPEEKNVKGKGKPKKTTDKRRISTNVVEPTLEWERRKDIRSVVGIHLGPKSLYWAKVSRDRGVLEWRNVDLFPTVESSRKMQLPKLFAIMENASESIPFSDIFVLEAPNSGILTSVSSPAVIAGTILRSQMIAILLTILNLRLENEDDVEEYYHKVFLLKPRIVSRFFNLLVGTERVSALALVDVILGIKDPSPGLMSKKMDEISSENDETANEDKPVNYKPLSAPSSIRESYSSLGAVEREAMSQALLSAVAFFELVVFNDSKVLPPLGKQRN